MCFKVTSPSCSLCLGCFHLPSLPLDLPLGQTDSQDAIPVPSPSQLVLQPSMLALTDRSFSTVSLSSWGGVL